MNHQEASAVWTDWSFLLYDAADAALNLIDQGNSSIRNEKFTEAERSEYRDHLALMLTAIPMMHQRTRQYGVGKWRHIGWSGQLLRTYDKTMRLMYSLWWSSDRATRQDPMDSVVDLVNHAVFTLRAWREGNERGADFQ